MAIDLKTEKEQSPRNSFNGKLKEFLKELFNQILETGSYPDQWKRGIIKPIFKSGAKSDPINYRGITLLNTIGKIFTSVINRRLLDWAESANMINDSQFGFREGRRTIDAIYTLTSVMHLYKRKHKPLYACFVDFRKAFDSINCDNLWLKLTKAGLYEVVGVAARHIQKCHLSSSI